MRKKEWIRVGLALIVALLFVLVIVVVMNFIRTRQTYDLSPEEPQEEEIIFRNSSDMSEQEIRELVEERRMALKDFFKNAEFYLIGDVALDYTEEDNEKYLVVNETFLNDLRGLLTLDAYNEYWNQFTEIEPKKDVLLSSRIYMAPRDLFDSIYVTSAIPSYDVSEELLVLESATNDKIIARENIKLCDEDLICRRNDFYELNLEKEDDTWKIDNFTTLIEE